MSQNTKECCKTKYSFSPEILHVWWNAVNVVENDIFYCPQSCRKCLCDNSTKSSNSSTARDRFKDRNTCFSARIVKNTSWNGKKENGGHIDKHSTSFAHYIIIRDQFFGKLLVGKVYTKRFIRAFLILNCN